MISIQEALRELREEPEEKVLHGNTKYPQMHNLRELLDFYDFLYYDKNLETELTDTHFFIFDNNNYSDSAQGTVRSINTQVDNRKTALARYFGNRKVPGNNLYASVDINTQGNIGTIRLFDWNVHSQSKGLNQFKKYLEEFYKEKAQVKYSPEEIEAYLDLLIPSNKGVRLITSKDRDTALQVSFGLQEKAPEIFKRTYNPDSQTRR